MKNSIISHLYILNSISLGVYCQLMFRWQMSKAGAMPELFFEKLKFLLSMFFNFWILSAFFGGFISALSWMAALNKFELSYAYPFTSLSFVFILLLSSFLFNETLTLHKIIGSAFIILGVIIIAK